MNTRLKSIDPAAPLSVAARPRDPQFDCALGGGDVHVHRSAFPRAGLNRGFCTASHSGGLRPTMSLAIVRVGYRS